MKLFHCLVSVFLCYVLFVSRGYCHLKSFVVAPRVHNAIDIITPVSFRVATNFKPHYPNARIAHTDVWRWSKFIGGGIKNPWVWRRILYGPGKDPYTGYFIY